MARKPGKRSVRKKKWKVRGLNEGREKERERNGSVALLVESAALAGESSNTIDTGISISHLSIS